MYSMGIYDSGIGGLTTLAVLKKNFENCSFFFLADTLNNPLGTKSCGEIVKNVNDGIDVLRKNCHLQVVACNTASTVVKPKGTYMLRPDVDPLNAQSALLLCTPATSMALHLKEKGFAVADTKNLATAVEIIAQTAYNLKDATYFNNLENCVKSVIEDAISSRKIDTVYLGCSHYLYFKNIVRKLYPNMLILDGNERLILDIKSSENIKSGQGKTTFEFTLGNQTEKYNWLLDQLEKNPYFSNI